MQKVTKASVADMRAAVCAGAVAGWDEVPAPAKAFLDARPLLSICFIQHSTSLDAAIDP